MKPDLLEILQHTLGCDKYGHGTFYRNYFVAGGDDEAKCEELIALGFMAKHPKGGTELTGGMPCYFVTDEGKEAMRDASPVPPKVSRGRQRYLDFLHADCGLSFGEWLNLLKFRKKS